MQPTALRAAADTGRSVLAHELRGERFTNRQE